VSEEPDTGGTDVDVDEPGSGGNDVASSRNESCSLVLVVETIVVVPVDDG